MHRLRAHFGNWVFRRIFSPFFRRFFPVVVISPTVQRIGLYVARVVGLRRSKIPTDLPRLAFIWRHADVSEVLGDYEHFSVSCYDEKMKFCSNQFFLGYDFRNPEYRHDIALWRSIIRPEDRDWVTQIAVKHSWDAVASAAPNGRIDVVQDLVGPVVAGFLNDYFGVPEMETPRPGELSPLLKTFLATASYIFSLEIATGPTADQAKQAGLRIKEHIERLIKEKRAARPRHAVSTTGIPAADTILDRFLDTDEPDELIRRIVGGTVSGAIAVTFSQCLWVIDRLLDLPAAELAAIRHIAEEGNDALIGRYVREASRFKPFPPGLFRRCDTKDGEVVGHGTWYERRVPEKTLFVNLTWSAAFDERVVPDPHRFYVGREDQEYLLFGTGQHTCPAAQPDRPIAQTLMTQMVKALFTLPGLDRARGSAGFIQGDPSAGGWPAHFVLQFDRLRVERERRAVAA